MPNMMTPRPADAGSRRLPGVIMAIAKATRIAVKDRRRCCGLPRSGDWLYCVRWTCHHRSPIAEICLLSVSRCDPPSIEPQRTLWAAQCSAADSHNARTHRGWRHLSRTGAPGSHATTTIPRSAVPRRSVGSQPARRDFFLACSGGRQSLPSPGRLVAWAMFSYTAYGSNARQAPRPHRPCGLVPAALPDATLLAVRCGGRLPAPPSATLRPAYFNRRATSGPRMLSL